MDYHRIFILSLSIYYFSMVEGDDTKNREFLTKIIQDTFKGIYEDEQKSLTNPKYRVYKRRGLVFEFYEFPSYEGLLQEIKVPDNCPFYLERELLPVPFGLHGSIESFEAKILSELREHHGIDYQRREGSFVVMVTGSKFIHPKEILNGEENIPYLCVDTNYVMSTMRQKNG